MSLYLRLGSLAHGAEPPPTGLGSTVVREALSSSALALRERAQPPPPGMRSDLNPSSEHRKATVAAGQDTTHGDVGADMSSSTDPSSTALRGLVAIAEEGHRADPGSLAADVRGWLASPQQSLSADVDTLRGRADTAAALGRLAPSALTVAATVPTPRGCWAEISRLADGGAETCVVGLTLGDRDDVVRLIWFRAPAVPTGPRVAGPPPADGRAVVESYFDALMHARFREAARHFAIDTIYSHPPYRPGAPRVLFRGRDALWRGFAQDRGPTPARQVVTGFWQREELFFVEGVIEGIPDGGTFVSAGRLTPAGAIARYVAFYSSQRIAGHPAA
jgi:hypothetical protein